tara:strand:+ start:384 stop:530 length:147 start_codon:yes stop_codon:yes gene_type:complete
MLPCVGFCPQAFIRFIEGLRNIGSHLKMFCREMLPPKIRDLPLLFLSA